MSAPTIHPITSAAWVESITIAAGATGLSPEIDLGGGTLFALELPAGWVSADVTFMAATSPGGTYRSVVGDDGVEVKATVGAGDKIVPLANVAVHLAALRWVKIRSGTFGVPVNQTGAPTINLLAKG